MTRKNDDKKRLSKPLPFWASARSDCREYRFIQVGDSLVMSKEFQDLNYSSKCIYFYMMMESAGKPKFKFPRQAALKYGVGWSTAYPAIKELMKKGFIVRTCSGKNTRTENEYKFSFEWKS